MARVPLRRKLRRAFKATLWYLTQSLFSANPLVLDRTFPRTAARYQVTWERHDFRGLLPGGMREARAAAALRGLAQLLQDVVSFDRQPPRTPSVDSPLALERILAGVGRAGLQEVVRAADARGSGDLWEAACSIRKSLEDPQVRDAIGTPHARALGRAIGSRPASVLEGESSVIGRPANATGTDVAVLGSL